MSKSNSDIARELGRSGGLKTLKKHGKDHYKQIANKRWAKEKQKRAEEASEQSESEE